MLCLECNARDFEKKEVPILVLILGKLVQIMAECYVCKGCNFCLMDAEQMMYQRNKYREALSLLQAEDV